MKVLTFAWTARMMQRICRVEEKIVMKYLVKDVNELVLQKRDIKKTLKLERQQNSLLQCHMGVLKMHVSSLRQLYWNSFNLFFYHCLLQITDSDHIKKRKD